MPSKTIKQANAAKLAGTLKAGKFPASKAGPAVKSMARSMSKDQLKHFMKVKEHMSEEQKRRLLIGLRKLKEEYTGNVGGETDIRNADNLQVNEDDMDTGEQDQEIISKTFDTEGDFDLYVDQRRGISRTPKEQQAIIGFTKVKPTKQDKFSVEYETTDNWGNNSTVIIKKLTQDGQFVWTAFTTHQNAEDEGNPEGTESPKKSSEEKPKEKGMPELSNLKEVAPIQSQQPTITANDPIRVIKTVPFTDEIQGAKILSDLLNSGKLGL